MYCILNYTRIKLRSRPPEKKSAYFTHPDFSAAKIKKKCANYASKYGIYWCLIHKGLVYDLVYLVGVFWSFSEQNTSPK